MPSTVPTRVVRRLPGVCGDSSFVSPSTADFTPAYASPLIDRGLYIPGINDGFKGAAPDIGAIESP